MKRILITGASKGLGWVCAQYFEKLGSQLIITGRNPEKLKELENEFEEIIEVRGAGLLLGIKTKTNNQKICELLTEKGLLTIAANDNIIRLAPPLIITNDEVDQAIEIINNVIKEIND